MWLQVVTEQLQIYFQSVVIIQLCMNGMKVKCCDTFSPVVKAVILQYYTVSLRVSPFLAFYVEFINIALFYSVQTMVCSKKYLFFDMFSMYRLVPSVLLMKV